MPPPLVAKSKYSRIDLRKSMHTNSEQDKRTIDKKKDRSIKNVRKKIDSLMNDIVSQDDTSMATLTASDLIAGAWLKRNWLYIVFVTILALVYTGNRYAFQQEQIETKRLNEELIDIRFKLLTTNSELRKHSRASIIEAHLKDSTLRPSVTPNFKLVRDGISEE